MNKVNYVLSFTFVLFFYSTYLSFVPLYFLDELTHKLNLLKEVALELSKEEDGKVVMWVFDSFSTLVSNAIEYPVSIAAYSGVIRRIFDLNDSLIPVAICSSATTAGALNASKSSHLTLLAIDILQSTHMFGFEQNLGFPQLLRIVIN